MSIKISTPLCPSCQRCVPCTGPLFSPSQDIVEAIRSSDASLGDFPDDHYRDRAMDAEQQAHALTSEIDRLLSLAQELSARRQRLLDFATQQRAITAPVRRLPDELLDKIFRLACAGVVFTYPLSKPMLAAASISHVCHRWRAIAMHDKQLWAPTCIKLHKCKMDKLPEQPTFKQLPPFQAALLAYLARSDPLPFAIDLQGGCIYHNGEWGPAEYVILPAAEFADAVRRRCHRARFGCISSVDNLMWVLRQSKRGNITLESLESLELEDRRRLSGNAQNIMRDLTEHAPRLRYWKQDIVDCDHDHGVIQKAPMHPLVRLEALWTDWDHATRALSSCNSLQELIIGLCDTTDTWGDSDRETMTLPQLESLTVVAVPARTVLGRLLSVLTAPRLRHARFRCATPDDERRINRKLAPDRTDFPHAELAGFLRRSNCVLESLALQGVCATPEDAVFVGERLPGTT